MLQWAAWLLKTIGYRTLRSRGTSKFVHAWAEFNVLWLLFWINLAWHLTSIQVMNVYLEILKDYLVGDMTPDVNLASPSSTVYYLVGLMAMTQ